MANIYPFLEEMMKQNLNIHPDLRWLAKIKPKTNSWLQIVILNFVFRLSIIFYRPPKNVKKRYFQIPGQKTTIILLSKKKQTPHKKALLFFHGGGFQNVGTMVHLKMMTAFLNDERQTAIYVKYRLAPKYPFPYALEQGYAAYLWLLENADELDIDPNQIAVAGDSAGGHLAIGLTMLVRDRLQRQMEKLLLIYPVIDDRQETASMKEFTDTPMWNAQLNHHMWSLYLPDKNHEMIRYARFLDADLTDFPETYIETAEYDCLRDEGLLFGEHLKKAGIPVVINETKQTVHGYDAAFYSPFVKEIIQKRSAFLKGEENEKD